MRRLILGVLVLFSLWVLPGYAEPDLSEVSSAVAEIELLDAMRNSLAQTIDPSVPPTQATFKAVCAPVGQQAKSLAKEHGWQIRQVASKYRNPDHQPRTDLEQQALAEFATHPQLQGFWQVDQEGVHYFRRITVQASCLACHGDRAQRPEFIKNKYPNDLAYNFQVGDLRGMYSVLIPIQQALQQP